MSYLAFCAIARDEDPFLEEWIAYHTLLGVETFFIYDHQSHTPIAKTLAHLVRHGFVNVIPVAGIAAQLPSYNHCLAEFGHNFKWIGFFDLDEFLVPKHVDDLRIMLSEFEDYAALGVNWINFGTNGHENRPQGLLIENYTATCEDAFWSSHVKCLVRTDRAREFDHTPHFPSFRPGSVAVNENFKPFWGPFNPLSHDRCQINHYYFKSLEDYRKKLARGCADGNVRYPVHPVPRGYLPDLTIQRFIPRLKALMAGGAIAIAELAATGARPWAEIEAVNLASQLVAEGEVDKAHAILCNACLQHPRAKGLLSLRECLVRQRSSERHRPSLVTYFESYVCRVSYFFRRVRNFLKKIRSLFRP